MPRTPSKRSGDPNALFGWHYQWLVLHEFLLATIGATLAHDIATNGRKFRAAWRNDPYIPVEFSVAGPSVRPLRRSGPSYRANFGTSATTPAQQFIALIFDPCGSDAS